MALWLSVGGTTRTAEMLCSKRKVASETWRSWSLIKKSNGTSLSASQSPEHARTEDPAQGGVSAWSGLVVNSAWACIVSHRASAAS